MEAAHRENVVHRNLKPANVLLTSGVAPAPREGERGYVSAPRGDAAGYRRPLGLRRRLAEVADLAGLRDDPRFKDLLGQ
jgi:hypothetical protein